MNLAKLFETKKERNEAISQMRQLKDNPNWKFLKEKIILPDIEEISEEILSGKFESLEVINDLKRRRAYMVILSQLPDEIEKALKENKEDVMDFDPYPRNVKEIKKMR